MATQNTSAKNRRTIQLGLTNINTGNYNNSLNSTTMARIVVKWIIQSFLLKKKKWKYFRYYFFLRIIHRETFTEFFHQLIVFCGMSHFNRIVLCSSSSSELTQFKKPVSSLIGWHVGDTIWESFYKKVSEQKSKMLQYLWNTSSKIPWIIMSARLSSV